MFSVHTQTEFRSRRTGTLCYTGYDFRDAIVSVKLSFQNVFRPHANGNPACSNSFVVKSGLEKLRFRDGLVWMVGQIVGVLWTKPKKHK